jgi:prolyl 4-hydroxylase
MIQEFKNILSVDECNELIYMSKDKLFEATTLGTKIKDYRVAENTWLFEKTNLNEKIKNIVSEKTGLPIDYQEGIHIVKYNVGGEYKEHHDFFPPNTDYYHSQIKKGGQRIYSCLFYLNDDFLGGETHFPKVNYKVKPKLGKLVIWKNLNDDLSINSNSLHAGLPVTSGEKWICIIWVRERKITEEIIKEEKNLI